MANVHNLSKKGEDPDMLIRKKVCVCFSAYNAFCSLLNDKPYTLIIFSDLIFFLFLLIKTLTYN